jgi:hypothetical protein
MTENTCSIIGKVFALMRDPGGRERLERFLEESETIMTTAEVAAMTRWSTRHVQKLCALKRLPHIPGNPHLFIYSDLMAELRKMQVGGDFGRYKTVRKMETKCPARMRIQNT